MKNVILLFCIFSCFSTHIIAQYQDDKKSLTCCIVDKSSEDSLKITNKDLLKYKEAYDYILSDSINQGKGVFVSNVVVDMDRFYFKNYVKNDSTLNHTINSLTKYYWFENIVSFEIKKFFGEQNKNAESVLFFSLIEKNTLRADLFYNRKNKNEFRYNWLSNYNVDEVYAYLFFFDEIDKIKHVYRTKISYEI